MKILIVHADKFPWATFNRAESLKKELREDWIDIVDRWHLPEEEYDVIHFLFSGGITKCKDYILKHKDKVFTTLASYRTLEERWDKMEDLKEIYQNTVCCVAQNTDLEDRYKKLFGNNVVYIPNGVNEQRFKRNFIVGFVGIDNGHKGLELIKQACKELNLDLMIAEKGKNQEEMRDFYKEIDCLAIASKSEGCNNPTLEMLAMNKPVISTRVGIAEELEGVILIERDVESIKQALRKLSGRIQILENYTWKKIAKKYRDVWTTRK